MPSPLTSFLQASSRDYSSIPYHRNHQAQLSANGFHFKSLGLAECAKRIGAETRTCPGSEIQTRYDKADHKAITEHITEDVLTTEKLFNYLVQGG